ncbi:hypothetical protein JCM19233_6361 [Vibrio astriarenae]|nr:hypothetical protein JCM19233_6361 [Vibrio sp. C7]
MQTKQGLEVNGVAFVIESHELHSVAMLSVLLSDIPLTSSI